MCVRMERNATPCYNESKRLKLALQHHSDLLLPFPKSCCRRWGHCHVITAAQRCRCKVTIETCSRVWTNLLDGFLMSQGFLLMIDGYPVRNAIVHVE